MPDNKTAGKKRTKRYKPAVGDVWRATSVDGFVYFQVAGEDVLRPFPAAFVRALPGVYKAALGPEEIRTLVRGREQFIIRYPFEHFVNLPRFSFEGNFELPEGYVYPPPMRTTGLHRRESTIWDTDGEELTPDEYLRKHPGADLADVALPTLPMSGLLINMARAGWTPRMHDDDPGWLARLLGDSYDDEGQGPVADDGRRPGVSTSHLLLFSSKRRASAAATSARRDFRARASSVAGPLDLGGTWSVTVTVPGLPSSDDREALRALAEDHGGSYDGDEVGPLR